MGEKTCTKCGKPFPATTEYFYAREISKDGFKHECKACVKERCNKQNKKNAGKISEQHKRYREENAEKITEYLKRYAEENKEKIAEKNKLYRGNNKEKLSENKKEYYKANLGMYKQYYQENIEKIAEKDKRYKHEHLENYRINNQKRRVLKKNLLSTLTLMQWEEIKQHFNNRCAYCGEEKTLTQEHFIPLTKGGEYTHNNILPVCQSCNSSKSDKDFSEWYPMFKHYSKKRERVIFKFLNYHKGIQQLAIGLVVS